MASGRFWDMPDTASSLWLTGIASQFQQLRPMSISQAHVRTPRHRLVEDAVVVQVVRSVSVDRGNEFDRQP